MNPLQAAIMAHVADFAGQFKCVDAIYVFGSIGRGETERANDVDLMVGFADLNTRLDLAPSYTAFQAAFEDWALSAGQHFGKPFVFSRVYWTDRDNDAWRAVQLAAEWPVARIGKAVLAATPRHTPKP
jgi:predicted nucleotidyltransferase